jgi:hypothetical protein
VESIFKGVRGICTGIEIALDLSVIGICEDELAGFPRTASDLGTLPFKIASRI